jgi:hypothetical protein
MKSVMSLSLRKRNVNVFIACLLSFSLFTMPFVPMASALERTDKRASSASRPNPTGKHSPSSSTVTAAEPALFVPTITATKVDALISDDGDSKADPGGTEKIEYTITVSNTGSTDASSVVFTDTIDTHTTLVGGSINTQPIADPDTYTASGNIAIAVAAPGVLTNDRDPDTGNNSGLTVTQVQGAGANVGVATDTTATGRGSVKGKVTLNSNGSFSYEPAPGFVGNDTFTYQISDGTKTDTATVTITLSNMVWFISNNAGGLNQGTFTNPFTSIASFNTANAGTGVAPDPKNNDFISLRTGTGTYNEADGINLRAQQKVIGNAVQFNTAFSADANSNSAYTTFAGAVGAAPTITTTAGNGVDLSTDNTIRGFNVGAISGSFFKINGTAVGNLVLNTLTASGGGAALNVSTSGTFGSNVTFTSLESTSAAAGLSNINLVSVTGTLAATAGGTGLTNTGANPIVNISGGSVSFSYPGAVSRTSGAGTVVSVAGGHTGTLTFVSTSASAGGGLAFDNADGAYNFNTSFGLTGGTAGINITNGSSGTFNWPVGSITGIAGIPLNVGTSPGNPSVTFSGTITHNNAGTRAVNIDGTTGGSIGINSVTAGSIAGGVGNTGININNAAGSVTFTTLNLGTSSTRMTAQAVTIAGGSGAKSLGTVSIFTTGAAEGIHSTTTTGAISITTGSIDSAGAAAVNIAGTSAGSRTPLNVQLTSLAANGGAKGLILLNTSATGSPGGFRINGTGTTDGSGGTIQNTTTRGADIQTAESILLKNMNFTNANSSVDGGSAGGCDDLVLTACNSAIYLNGITTLATFDNLSLTGTMVENGVTAIGVANFKFDNSLIDGAGNEVHESGLETQNLSGTATVNNTEIRFSETDAFAVTNTDTSVNLTISGSTFRDSQTQSSGGPVNTNGEGGFQFRSFSVAAGQPTATINIINSSFLRLRTQAIQPFALDDTILNIDITGCTLDSQADIGTGIDINSDDSATVSFNIVNNPTIQSRGGSAVNITSFLDSHMEGRLNNNTDIEVLGGAGIPVRLVAQETSDMIVEINGNTVSNVNGTEDTTIDVQSRFQTARVDATITNNTVSAFANGVAGINLISGSSTAGESNITCGDVANNNVANAAANATRAHRIRISDLSNTNRIFLEGFVDGGATATNDTEATWNARGNQPVSAAGNEVTASLTGTAVGPLAPPGGVCLAVDTPADFFAPVITTGKPGIPTRSTAAGSTSEGQQDQDAPAVENPSKNSSQISKAVTPSVKTPVAKTSVSNNQLAAARTEAKRTDKRSGKTLSHHPRLSSPRALPAVMAGETVTVNIGTLRAGDSVTITFQVTVNDPPNLTGVPPGPPQVSNQGTVTYNDGVTPQTPVLTDDTAVGGAADPTVTPVDLFDTTTSLLSNLNPSNQGEQVTFTATVTETPTQASANPTGTVDFIDTSNANAVICNDVTLTAGSAQCQTSSLTAGTHNIRADYSGDGNFDPSQSNVVAQVVNACTTNPVVTSTADSGAGSLREALGTVCTGNTITFNIPGPGPHTITITSGDLQIPTSVTINNNSGKSIIVSGNDTHRVFNIAAIGTTAAIVGLTISDGLAFGGGAIANGGTLTVVNTTFTGNAASAASLGGGAIYNGGSLTIINSTFSANTSVTSGGAIFNDGGTVTIINSTITNNIADSDNNAIGTGGGIFNNTGTTTLRNTIVAGNFNEDGASDAADDIGGTVEAASSFNLIGTGGAGGLTDGVNNNQVGVANAGLGPLANNGGTTMTHALLATSPAVEAGSNANLPATDTFDLDGDTVTAETLPVDQRGVGFPRVADSADANTTQTVDIGAYESHPTVEDITNKTTAEDTALPQFTFNLGDGTGSLIQSVTATSNNTLLIPNANIVVTGSGSTRNLDISPAPDANTPSEGTATITVTVTATNGRTAVDTFDVTVTEVNDAPVPNNDTVANIDEDSGVYSIPFATLLTNDTNKGAANESSQTLNITAVSSPVGGTVQINGSNVEFTPTANFSGSASFVYTVTDNGTTNGVSDPKTGNATVNFTVNAVNDPPSFTIAGNPAAVNEDAGAQTVSNFATSISQGASESGQTLTFNLSLTGSTGTLTFASGPAIDPITGNLTYTSNPDTNGTATYSVTLSDNGSNTPPNSNTSPAQSFTITVNAVDDAPTFQLGSNPSVGEDAGPQSIPGFAFNFQPGPVTATDEAGQTLVGYALTPTGTTGGLTFSATPVISNAGTLTFTANNNSAGSATFDVVATDTGSGTPPNVNQSAPVSFTITVGGTNDPPINTVPGPQSTNLDTPLTFSSGNGNQISVSDVDAAGLVNSGGGSKKKPGIQLPFTPSGGGPFANMLQVTLSVTNGTLTLSGTTGLSFSFSDGNGTGAGDGTADATMTFRGTIADINTALNGMFFTPTSGFNGTAVLTITSNDLGNTGTGGPQTDTDTVNISVSNNISVQDAKVAEPTSGTTNMLFTVSLSAPAGAGGVQVTYASAAGGGNPATPGSDYNNVGPTVLTFAAGQRIKTIAVPVLADADNSETNETLLLNLSSPVNGTIVDNQATGTITPTNTPGTFLISELRTSGPGGAGDDFVEFYNNTDSPLTVAASDASAGYGLFKKGADCDATPVLIGVIPNGTVIPARGHFLMVGSQYSLTNYGGTGAAAGNLTLSSDIESDANVAVFSTSDVGNISSAKALDAVGFGTNTGAVCDLLREGTNIPATGGPSIEYSFHRDSCGKGGSNTIMGTCSVFSPVDNNNNNPDFVFADTQGTSIAGHPQRLGAPGPENLANPIMRNSSMAALFLDQTVSPTAVPNRVRDFTPVTNGTFGTLVFRRRIQNNTGGNVTRLRFRIIDVTSFPATSGFADLRALTSVNVVVSGVNDSATCLAANGVATTPCNVTVSGTTLETPPNQPNGGAWNSTFSVGTITLGTPLPNGASANLQFVMGVQQTGTFKFYINIEALP